MRHGTTLVGRQVAVALPPAALMKMRRDVFFCLCFSASSSSAASGDADGVRRLRSVSALLALTGLAAVVVHVSATLDWANLIWKLQNGPPRPVGGAGVADGAVQRRDRRLARRRRLDGADAGQRRRRPALRLARPVARAPTCVHVHRTVFFPPFFLKCDETMMKIGSRVPNDVTSRSKAMSEVDWLQMTSF